MNLVLSRKFCASFKNKFVLFESEGRGGSNSKGFSA